MIEPVIRAQLIASTALVAIVGDKIRPTEAAETDQPPLVVYQVVDAEQADCLNDEADTSTENLLIDCFGDTYAQAKAIRDAVYAALHYFSGTSAGITTTIILHDGTRDLTQPATLGQGKRLYHFQMEFHAFFDL